VRRALVTASMVGLLGLAAVGAADAPQIGGPPSDDFDRCRKPLRHCTDPVVIGVGHHFNGRTEIVAYHSNLGLCIDLDRPSGGSGSCGGAPRPPGGEAIFASSFEYSSGRRGSSGVSGFVRPDVASVVIRFRRAGERERAKATLAQVNGELLDAVREERPFGVFESLVRGCVKPKHFRAVAFDASGEVLGRSRSAGISHSCRGESGGSTVTLPPATRRLLRKH